MAVSHFFRRIALGADDAIGGRELIHRDSELLRRHLEQRLARRGARLRQIAVIEIRGMRLAAGRVSLIRRQRRIAVNQLHAIEWHRQFFGHQLRLRGRDALAQLFLAAIGGDAAVGGDGDPGIHLIRSAATQATGATELSIALVRPC